MFRVIRYYLNQHFVRRSFRLALNYEEEFRSFLDERHNYIYARRATPHQTTPSRIGRLQIHRCARYMYQEI